MVWFIPVLIFIWVVTILGSSSSDRRRGGWEGGADLVRLQQIRDEQRARRAKLPRVKRVIESALGKLWRQVAEQRASNRGPVNQAIKAVEAYIRADDQDSNNLPPRSRLLSAMRADKLNELPGWRASDESPLNQPTLNGQRENNDPVVTYTGETLLWEGVEEDFRDERIAALRERFEFEQFKQLFRALAFYPPSRTVLEEWLEPFSQFPRYKPGALVWLRKDDYRKRGHFKYAEPRQQELHREGMEFLARSASPEVLLFLADYDGSARAYRAAIVGETRQRNLSWLYIALSDEEFLMSRKGFTDYKTMPLAQILADNALEQRFIQGWLQTNKPSKESFTIVDATAARPTYWLPVVDCAQQDRPNSEWVCFGSTAPKRRASARRRTEVCTEARTSTVIDFEFKQWQEEQTAANGGKRGRDPRTEFLLTSGQCDNENLRIRPSSELRDLLLKGIAIPYELAVEVERRVKADSSVWRQGTNTGTVKGANESSRRDTRRRRSSGSKRQESSGRRSQSSSTHSMILRSSGRRRV